jgi:hypothetical protein
LQIVDSLQIVKNYRYTIATLLLLFSLSSQAQRFFNLTTSEVRIDSLLPYFTYTQPLEGNYADSVYEVRIKYPEYIPMSQGDIARYVKLTAAPIPEKPEIMQRLAIDRKRGNLDIEFLPIVMHEGKPHWLVSFMIDVKAMPKKRSVRRANARQQSEQATRYAEHSVLAQGRWAKIQVPQDGVYQLTAAIVRQAGFTDLSRVKIYGYGGHLQNEKLVADELIATDDLSEVPTCTVNGKRLFYGKGPVSWDSNEATRRTRNPYSNYGCYFITEGDGEPLTVDKETFLSSFYPSANDYHEIHEVDNYAWYYGGRNLSESTPIALGTSKSYTMSNPAGAKTGTLSVCVSAGTASSFTVALNGEQVGRGTITIPTQYDKGNEASLTFSCKELTSENEVTISTTAGGPVRLDFISFAYDTPKAAPDLENATFSAPQYVYNISNQDHHADPQADMVIIIPASQHLLAQAQRLADLHKERDGLRVNIVPADELYNEFSSGTPDANAYRRYMKMLYDRAESDDDMPKSLLLFGDCVWDNRMLTSVCQTLDSNDYLLCFESENSFNEIYSYVDDGWFTLLDDGEGLDPKATDKQDIGVGRFPVTTAEEAKGIVDKCISYATNKYAGSWQNVIMFMGDDGNDNLHMRDVNNTAEYIYTLNPDYQVKKVMWDAYRRETSSTGNSYPEVTALIKQQQAEGALIMDYAGHGAPEQISHESVLRLSDFKAFTNTNLPLWVTASCDIMVFDGVTETIGEEALLNKKGGAVAFFGTTRTVYANVNKYINTSFLKHVLTVEDGKGITLGEAQRRAKNEMIETGNDRTQNKLQYSLLGDPALRLALPTEQVVIDKINGVVPSAADMQELKAGSIVTVEGHVETAGQLATDFVGKMTATVRDTRELITCRLNDPSEAEEAFSFYDRQKVLYNGSDSVRAGTFNFTFAVPRDINYANGTGLINVYAVNDDHTVTAHGTEDAFIINGSEELSNDSIGPSIYCYLNTPSFVNGGNVNSTPYFVANVTDKDGINATGSGIGHDLELIIDGEMEKTYNLNSNFTFDFGSYTSGTTYYNIPTLSPGAHSLKFRAWDILNNSSTAVLNFNVVQGLQPNLVDVNCTQNPAKGQTTFIVTHDFVNSNVDVEIGIFDMGGRELWRHQESGVSTGEAYTVDWDLTVDGGRPLQTGVYLYRVRLGSEGGSMASKAKKLIVIGNK